MTEKCFKNLHTILHASINRKYKDIKMYFMLLEYKILVFLGAVTRRDLMGSSKILFLNLYTVYISVSSL